MHLLIKKQMDTIYLKKIEKNILKKEMLIAYEYEKGIY